MRKLARRVGEPPFPDLPGFSYDPFTQTATFDFSQAGSPVISEPGFYTIEIPENQIFVSGAALTNERFEFSFYVALPSDANLDGQVDVLGDAFSLVGNLGLTSGATWSQGDFNGDGMVDVLTDAFILVGNLGRSVVPPAAASAVAKLAGSTSAQSVPTANSTDIVFVSLKDEADELFSDEYGYDNQLEIGLADELTLS